MRQYELRRAWVVCRRTDITGADAMSFSVRPATFTTSLNAYESATHDNLQTTAGSIVSARDDLNRTVDENREKVKRLQEELQQAKDDAGSGWGVFGWFFGDDSGVADVSGAGQRERIGAGIKQHAYAVDETYKRSIEEMGQAKEERELVRGAVRHDLRRPSNRYARGLGHRRARDRKWDQARTKAAERLRLRRPVELAQRVAQRPRLNTTPFSYPACQAIASGSAMNIADAGRCVIGWIGSRVSIKRSPLFKNRLLQASNVLKYHGAGLVKSALNPSHEPSLHPSSYGRLPHATSGCSVWTSE